MGVTAVAEGASFAHPHPQNGLSMAAPATGLQVVMGRGGRKGAGGGFWGQLTSTGELLG